MDFKTRLSDLWKRCELPPPQFGAENVIELSLEGARLRIAERNDGAGLLITGPAGRLSSDRRRRSDQVHAILGDNLAFLATRRVCVCLARDAGAPDLVEVVAVHNYEASLDSLMQTIEDVIGVQELRRADLRPDGAARRRAVPEQKESADVIFHP